MSVPIHTSVGELRGALAAKRSQLAIGLAPTMGALHRGHARLIEEARAKSGFVVVSIFVNPIQFDLAEDFERYARNLEQDAELCAASGADLIFAPATAEIYPPGHSTFVEVEELSRHFCGASRPGHFRGVATVVAKLFNIVAPQLAFFGEKDAQQLAIIHRMTRDLDLPIAIIPVPTVRESDGLALSSRNVRLNPAERDAAVRLYRALVIARRLIESGVQDAASILPAARRELDQDQIRVDYLGLADPETMSPIDLVAKPVRAMGAIWLGHTRLIDNLLCCPPHETAPLDSSADNPKNLKN